MGMASSICESPRRGARRLAPLMAVLWLWPCAARAAGDAPPGNPREQATGTPAGSATASAREAATARLVDGVALLRAGQYAAALAKFDEAYALVPSPNIHYNRGLSYLGLGKNAAALE